MKKSLIILISLFALTTSLAQTKNETQVKESSLSVYVGTAIPIASVDKNEVSTNFEDNTTLAFPIGLNIKKSEKLSYSFELAPVIQWTKNGSSVTSLSFLPGVLLHNKKFTYGIRGAFETSGRYGMSFSALTPIIKKEHINIVLGLPLDLRFGNNLPTNLGTGILLVAVL